MTKYLSTIGLILFFALCLLLSFGGSKTWKGNHTAETEARIISKGTGCGSSYTVVEFAYTVNNKRLENWTCFSHSQITAAGFAVNDKAKACYDPSNPKDASVIPAGYRCGK